MECTFRASGASQRGLVTLAAVKDAPSSEPETAVRRLGSGVGLKMMGEALRLVQNLAAAFPLQCRI